MNLILKRDPIWLGSLPSTNASPAILLLGVDGQPVSVPAPLLLAVSPLVRNILTDLLPPAYCPYFLSLPAVTEEVLHAMVDILATGTAGGEHMDKMQDVRQGFKLLGVSCHLASLEVGQALDKSIKVENYSEGPDEENIKLEITVKLEENKNGADVGGKVVKSKRLRKNLYQSTVESIKYIHKQDKFTCNLCPQRFSQKADLVKHIKSGHDQIKIPCNICQQQFTRKYLVRHIKSVHDQIKIPCKICSKKFTQRSNLVTHIKTIHDQIKIPCNICPQKFTQKGDLVRHIKSVHDQIKISCKICSKKFTQRPNLVTHIKTIHDQIKIPCNLCSKKFGQKANLVKHIKSVHEKIGL